jgi:TetR/AcrR family transcriptional repressor of mexCD-oprJ operon
VQALLQRGQREGALRSDIAPDLIGEMFGGIVLSGLRRALAQGLGIEEASAAVVSVFLNGAAARP